MVKEEFKPGKTGTAPAIMPIEISGNEGTARMYIDTNARDEYMRCE